MHVSTLIFQRGARPGKRAEGPGIVPGANLEGCTRNVPRSSSSGILSYSIISFPLNLRLRIRPEVVTEELVRGDYRDNTFRMGS